MPGTIRQLAWSILNRRTRRISKFGNEESAASANAARDEQDATHLLHDGYGPSDDAALDE